MRIVTLIAAVAAAVPACAATLIPVPPVPGAALTSVASINDNNQIAGYYVKPDGTEASFFGTLDGQYTTYDADPVNAPGSIARGINNDGAIIGVADETNSNGIGYERLPNGTVKLIKLQSQNALAVFGGGISQKGTFTVEEFRSDSTVVSFLGRKGKVKSQIDFGFPVQRIRARGLTDKTISGYFREDSGHHYHGFLLSDGVLTSVDYPDENAAITLFEGVNGSGMVSGYWEDFNFVDTAFLYNSKQGKFKALSVPGYPNSAALGINKKGLVALLGENADFTQIASFIYCPLKRQDCPAGGTEIADGKWIAATPGFRPRGPGIEPARHWKLQ